MLFRFRELETQKTADDKGAKGKEDNDVYDVHEVIKAKVGGKFKNLG